MTKQDREATAARNAERKRRQARCIYGSKYQKLITSALKRPLMTIATVVSSQFPEPTIENTWHPNSHKAIMIREEFKRNCSLTEDRKALIVSAINFAIMMYDYDPPYRDIMDWAKERIDASGWEPRRSQDLINYDWRWWNEEDTNQG